MRTGIKSKNKAGKSARATSGVAHRTSSHPPTKKQVSRTTGQLSISRAQLRDFCRRWAVTELALFGSVLRKDFRPDSDVDVLVTFAPTAHPTLLDLAHMQRELAALLGREVDLLTRRGVESSRNSIRRESILASAKTVYVA